MSQRIRGQEVTVQLISDGDLKGGSFAKVKNFNLTPRTDLSETDFLGEIESDIDIQHHGFDFDFEIDMADSKMIELFNVIVERERMRLPHPDLNVVVTFKFRSLTDIPAVIVLEHAKMKMDTLAAGGRKDYVNSKWSGKAKTCPQLL